MRSRTCDVGSGVGAEFGIRRCLVGIGKLLGRSPETVGDAVRALVHGYDQKAGRMLRRFDELPEGTLVWTRARDGSYRLGGIAGPRRYDSSTRCERSRD
jgi:hypothetical protein